MEQLTLLPLMYKGILISSFSQQSLVVFIFFTFDKLGEKEIPYKYWNRQSVSFQLKHSNMVENSNGQGLNSSSTPY